MQTKVILLERIAKLGQLGDVVGVKSGYARNYLLPQGKALRANKENIAYFETQKQQLEAHNLERKSEAEKIAAKLNGKIIVAIRSAGETGQLYGSVAGRDIVVMLQDEGFKIEKSQVKLQNTIKSIGLHEVVVVLHAEVDVKIIINVARTAQEAKKQEKGEKIDEKSKDKAKGTEKDKGKDKGKDKSKDKKQEVKAEEIFEKAEDVEKFEKDEKEETETESQSQESETPESETSEAETSEAEIGKEEKEEEKKVGDKNNS